MSGYRDPVSGSGVAAWLMPLVVLGIAVVAGMATAVVGGQAGYKAVYYAAVFGMLGMCILIAMMREEPLRLAYLALFLAFPMANALVPPGRFGFKIFDVVMIVTALGLLGKRVLGGAGKSEPLFPGRSMAIAWLLSIPCLAFSVFPVVSLQKFALNAGVYAFFLMTLRELKRPAGFQRIVTLLAIVMLMMDVGLFIDHFFHINLSMRGSNPNQTSVVSGVEVWRAGGFFPDPQTAAAFLACTITFMLLLLVRGRFGRSRVNLLMALAIFVSLAALLTTISRGAIMACAAVSALALFVFNRWSAPIKLLSAGAFVVLIAVLYNVSLESLLQLAPDVVAERFQDLDESFEYRMYIWFDTWDMFAQHPLTGIGMGSFRDYLLETRPGMVNYYGIGVADGVPYVPDQPENGYLKVLYEGGIAGALAGLLIVGDALRRAMLVIGRSMPDSAARTDGIAALAGIVTFGITFVTLFTWTDCRLSGLFMILIGVIWWRSLESSGPGTSAQQ